MRWLYELTGVWIGGLTVQKEISISLNCDYVVRTTYYNVRETYPEQRTNPFRGYSLTSIPVRYHGILVVTFLLYEWSSNSGSSRLIGAPVVHFPKKKEKKMYMLY